MLTGFLKRRTRAMRRDAFAAEANRNFVRIGIRAFHPSMSAGVVDIDVLDDFAFLVVEPPQESAGAEQPAKAAIR